MLACRGTAAVVCEVEAYHEDEQACHAYGGRRTAFTEDLFGEAGTAYVYFTYGMHWCSNLVTGPAGSGEAVLLRAAVPLVGEELMAQRRGRERDLLTGPARLTQAMDIRKADSGGVLLREDLHSLDEALEAAQDGPVLAWLPQDAARVVAAPIPVTDADVLVGPRIGISVAKELPWRLAIAGTRVSKPFPRS